MRRVTYCCAALTAAALAGCSEGGVSPRHVVPGGAAARGQAHLVDYGCGSCHEIPGVPMAVGRVGPSLAGLARRSHIAGGALVNDASTLVSWIVDPQRHRPGTLMPALGVRVEHARDMGAYLYSLQGDHLGPSRLIPARRIPGHGGH